MAVDTVVTKYILDPSGYVAGAQRVKSATAQTSQSVTKGSVDAKGFFSDLAKGMAKSSAIAGAASVLVTGAVAGVALAFAALGAEVKAAFGAVNDAANFQALESSIVAIEGNAKKAGEALFKLKEIAKAPGVEFEGGVKGYGGLRRAGLGSEFSFRAVAGAGKANALSGGGAEEFARVMLAMTQIANKPFLQGDELNQLQDAGINAYQPIKKAFGTSDTEELKKRGITSKMVLEALVKSFEKLPQAAGGMKNEIENLASSFKFAKIEFGKGLFDTANPLLGGLSKLLDKATESGVLTTMASSLTSIFDALTGGVDGMKEAFIGGVAAVMTFNNLMEGLVSVIRKVVGVVAPIAGWFLDKGFGGMVADNVMNLFKTNAESVKKLMNSPDKKPPKKDKSEKDKPEPPTPPVFQQIADNTRKIAENTMQRHIMGGGDLARLGVTPVEMRKASHGGARRGSAKSVEQKIRDLVEELSYMHVVNHANIQTGQKRAGAF